VTRTRAPLTVADLVAALQEHPPEARVIVDGYEDNLRIPRQAGHSFRFEAGRDSEMKPDTIPK
jgi:hypothetical protein